MDRTKQFTIYGLCQPVNSETFYIGSSSIKLKERLHLHLHGTSRAGEHTKLGSYLKELEVAGMRPEIYPIETLSYEEKRIAEDFWISMYRSWGFNLCNERAAYKAPRKKQTRR